MDITIEEWYDQLQQYASGQGQAGLPPQDALQSLYDQELTPQEAFEKLWPPAREVIEAEPSTIASGTPIEQEAQSEDDQAIALAESFNEPRVTEEDVIKKIVKKTFTLLPSGSVVICEIITQNGFIAMGKSVMGPGETSNVSAQSKALQDAVRQVWSNEVYLLREQQYQSAMAKLRAQTVAIEDQSGS